MKIIDMIKDRKVKFIRFKQGNLYYKIIGVDFEFPVPVEDTGEATFLNEDKASFFMRYIRKHKALLDK